jgi:hypothetical protein
MSLKTKMDIPAYEGSLDAEELLDWIRSLILTSIMKILKMIRRLDMSSQG